MPIKSVGIRIKALLYLDFQLFHFVSYLSAPLFKNKRKKKREKATFWKPAAIAIICTTGASVPELLIVKCSVGSNAFRNAVSATTVSALLAGKGVSQMKEL